MFGLLVRFSLKDGSAAAFDALAEQALGFIRDVEPRTRFYACHATQDDPNVRVFYELYEDEAAFDEHEEQGHIRRFLAEARDHLTRPPQAERLTLLMGKEAATS